MATRYIPDELIVEIVNINTKNHPHVDVQKFIREAIEEKLKRFTVVK